MAMRERERELLMLLLIAVPMRSALTGSRSTKYD